MNPTIDNKICDIPFKFNERDNYFCIKNDQENIFQCKTTENVFSQCNIGTRLLKTNLNCKI